MTADDAVAIPEGDRPRLPRLGLVALAALAIGLGAMATTYSANHITDPRHDTDLLLYFLPAAAGITPDHPFQIYAVRAGEYPNFLPPLPIVAMAAVLEAARAVHLPGVQTCVAAGFNDLACRPLVAAVALAFLPFVLALAWLVAWLVRRLRPTASAGDLLLAFGLVAVSPLAWQDFTKWWHVEQPLMLLFLLGGVALLLRSRPLAGGVLLGLALLTRLTALVPIVTLGVAALTATVPGARRTALLAGGAIAATCLVGFGPFVLADPGNALYSLVSWRAASPIGLSIWAVLIGTPLEPLGRSLDGVLVVALAAGLGLVAGRWWGIGPRDPRILGPMAVASLLVPVLSKSTYPYYWIEPAVLLVTWELAAPATTAPDAIRRPLLSLLFLTSAATAGLFLYSNALGGLELKLLGLVQFAWLGGFLAVAWRQLAATYGNMPLTASRSRPSSPPAGADS